MVKDYIGKEDEVDEESLEELLGVEKEESEEERQSFIERLLYESASVEKPKKKKKPLFSKAGEKKEEAKIRTDKGFSTADKERKWPSAVSERKGPIITPDDFPHKKPKKPIQPIERIKYKETPPWENRELRLSFFGKIFFTMIGFAFSAGLFYYTVSLGLPFFVAGIVIFLLLFSSVYALVRSEEVMFIGIGFFLCVLTIGVYFFALNPPKFSMGSLVPDFTEFIKDASDFSTPPKPLYGN